MHIGIIMDGNGRWATARALPRTAGHHAGVRAARRIVESAVRADVDVLTLYAFSADNWGRPRTEVSALMRLLRRSLDVEAKRCEENGVRLTIVGRRDRLPNMLRVAVEDAEERTRAGTNLHLRVAVDYSARDAILRAAAAAAASPEQPLTRERFSALLAAVHHDPEPVPDVDLLIRTGGEQRLSDFLLWECAYAELHFVRRMWPDFGEDDFLAALHEFQARDRRFGAVGQQAAAG
ncbi:MAG: undecaprenyl diphosphate synthase [Gemmatimonadetes bacterium]|nr:undecaprenyl diphosphate synthase [Gemmatimonadota bacterium]